ncbi:potassium voltage-gated channel subfamily E member 2-like [Rhinophrynus dorsalis]
MSFPTNFTSSLEKFLENLLKNFLDETYKNITQKEGKTERSLENKDLDGAVAFIMILLGIFAFFIISVLVIAVKSRSYEQPEDLPSDYNASDSDVKSALHIQEGIKCLIHKNKAAT